MDEAHPDAFVIMGLALSVSIPGGIILRAFEESMEEDSWRDAFTYDRFPVALLAAYGFSSAAFGALFSDGKSANALASTHYALSSVSALCALRHSHRQSEVSRRASGAIILSFIIAFSVVLYSRMELHFRNCSFTMAILTVFCAAPCWRVYGRTRMHQISGDQAICKAKKRGAFISAVMVLELALQPWLGVCAPPAPWAEPVLMGGELAILALATESLWS
jgi:hypothetical protein